MDSNPGSLLVEVRHFDAGFCSLSTVQFQWFANVLLFLLADAGEFRRTSARDD